MIYGCECPRRRCRERLRLRPDEYAALAAKGAVVSKHCAHRDRRAVLGALRDARAVVTDLSGGGRVAALNTGGAR